MITPARLAAAAAALCLATAPAVLAQQSTTNGSSGTMRIEKGKDAGMARSGSMMSTKGTKSGMAQAGTADDGAMSHSGDKIDKMEK